MMTWFKFLTILKLEIYGTIKLCKRLALYSLIEQSLVLIDFADFTVSLLSMTKEVVA